MKQRYYLLDAFRGLSILAMIWYHAMWDLVNVCGLQMPWFESDTGFVIQRTIRWCFVLLGGFCVCMGSRPVKRGILLLVCSCVVTAASFVAGSPIVFGVLTFLGLATLLAAFWKWLWRNVKTKVWMPWLGALTCLLLFLLTVNLEIGQLWKWTLPRSLYANYVTALLGFPPLRFSSSDYVPLIPWIFAYGLGYFLYGILKSRQWLGIFCKFRIAPLEFLGRHSLLIYLVHQPILYGILYIL